jgi:hypothetical protein
MIFFFSNISSRGRDSSVSIATCYRLDGPGIESRWKRDFPHCSDRPCAPTSLLYNGYRVFPEGKAAGPWRWPLTLSRAEVKEGVELYLYSPFWAVVACSRVNYTFYLQHIYWSSRTLQGWYWLQAGGDSSWPVTSSPTMLYMRAPINSRSLHTFVMLNPL